MRIKPLGLKTALASLLAGAAIPLGFSPFNFWPVLMLAIAVTFTINRRTPLKTALTNGFCFGLGFFGVGVSWVYVSINQFGSAPAPLAILLTALFIASLASLFTVPLFGLYHSIIHRRIITRPWQQALVFSALWVLFEWLRSVLLTGFPWLFVGYALLDTPFSGWAPVAGTYGLSFLVVASSCALAAISLSRGAQRAPVLLSAALALFWLAAIPLGQVQWTQPTGTVRFSAVQGNIPQNLKWDPSYIQTTLSTYTNLTRTEWRQDLIIWPENAIPLLYSQAGEFLQPLDQAARQQNSSLITGLPIDQETPQGSRYYNGIIALGQGQGRYFKQKLVPFGEYVPLEGLLRGLIAFFNLPMSSFSPGSADQQPLTVGDTVIASYICYEVVYPDFAARAARNTGLLITISNDTWFGRSIGPQQHFQMARMRALETGRNLIRATNDGITALVGSSGQVLKRIPRFQSGVLRGRAQIVSGNTPFMITGSWPILLFAAALLLGLTFYRRPADHWRIHPDYDASKYHR